MFVNFLNKNRRSPDYDEDFFRDTRMSFGDHLEELRTRMWKAIKGLGFFLIIGFILDGIGERAHLPWLGIGRPMLRVVVEPVKERVKEYYHDRNIVVEDEVEHATAEDKRNKTVDIHAKVPVQTFVDQFDGLKPKNPEQTHMDVVLTVRAADVYTGGKEGEYVTDGKNYVQGMGIMEGFMVYFKMSLFCGFILACPWVFYQMWAFIGAGLYPHEKKLIHVYLPYSVGLFIGGMFDLPVRRHAASG